jgi:hypothetical protein
MATDRYLFGHALTGAATRSRSGATADEGPWENSRAASMRARWSGRRRLRYGLGRNTRRGPDGTAALMERLCESPARTCAAITGRGREQKIARRRGREVADTFLLDDPRDPTALACVREEPKTLRNSAELDLRTVADKERAARIIISVAQAQADIDAARLREKAVRRVKGWLTWQQPPQIDEGAASGSPSTVRHLPA